MGKSSLVLFIILICIPLFPEPALKHTGKSFFVLPDLILFGEEQFFLLPFPLNRKINVIMPDIEDYTYIRLTEKIVHLYPETYTLRFPEKYNLNRHPLSKNKYLYNMSANEKKIRKYETKFDFLYGPYSDFYGSFSYLTQYELWNYSLNLYGRHIDLLRMFSGIIDTAFEKQSYDIPLSFKILYGGSFESWNRYLNLVKTSFRAAYKKNNLYAETASSAFLTLSDIDTDSNITGTFLSGIKLQQYSFYFLPSVSIKGAVWNLKSRQGYDFALAATSAYEMESFNIGLTFESDSTGIGFYPYVSYRNKINDTLYFSIYSAPVLSFPEGMEEYLLQGQIITAFLPVNNFEKAGVLLHGEDKNGNSGSVMAEIAYGNFMDISGAETDYISGFLLNFNLSYSKAIDRWFSGKVSYGFQQKFKKILITDGNPVQMLVLQVLFDFIKIPLQIIINADVSGSFLPLENLDSAMGKVRGNKNGISIRFVFSSVHDYNAGIQFGIYGNDSDNEIIFKNSVFLTLKTRKYGRD
ncbi:MAG: hypothetical protein GXP33_08970 [Spirochaetes bacterium]|nr:hypothetical protein [Spirochaetota bacterium]